MKNLSFAVLVSSSLMVFGQNAFIGRSKVELTSYNGSAALSQTVSMPFGYRGNCPTIVGKEISQQGTVLKVRVEFDATSFNLACGCETSTTIILNGFTPDDVRQFEQIEVHSDVRAMIDGVARLSKDEDVAILYRSESSLSADFFVLRNAWVYPNPAVNVLNLEIPANVEIKDMYGTASDGRVVDRIPPNARLIDLQSYTAGQYYLWIVGSSDRAVRNFLVVK